MDKLYDIERPRFFRSQGNLGRNVGIKGSCRRYGTASDRWRRPRSERCLPGTSLWSRRCRKYGLVCDTISNVYSVLLFV